MRLFHFIIPMALDLRIYSPMKQSEEYSIMILEKN